MITELAKTVLRLLVDHVARRTNPSGLTFRNLCRLYEGRPLRGRAHLSPGTFHIIRSVLSSLRQRGLIVSGPGGSKAKRYFPTDEGLACLGVA